jgi:hypothetical protein
MVLAGLPAQVINEYPPQFFIIPKYSNTNMRKFLEVNIRGVLAVCLQGLIRISMVSPRKKFYI